MRIASFKIKDFRSIESAEVPLADLTCLVGANNGGKSNILRAAMTATAQMLDDPRPVAYRRSRLSQPIVVFDQRNDMPIGKPNGKPSVDITLNLTDDECAEFKSELKNTLNGELKFRINLMKPGPDGVTVMKQKSGGILTEKSQEIAAFVRRRLRLEYIPAVRTSDQSVDIVRRLVSDQLRVLRTEPAYNAALQRVQELESPILRAIESDLVQSLADFLPDLQAIKLSGRQGANYPGAMGSSLNIEVDDGFMTVLEAKGDGVQSLAAIALARRAAFPTNNGSQHLILAIEEPETHLHPGAVRQLRSVLREISTQQQVILTTHSPLLIDTERPRSNVVVANQKAKPARRVAEIRECLGVAVADNLVSARLVVLVEGPGDQRVLSSLLSGCSPTLAKLIRSGELILEPLGGASKLSAHASGLRATACSLFVVLDADREAVKAIETASKAGRIAANDYLVLRRPGMDENEIEDLFDFDVYGESLAQVFDLAFSSSLGNGKGPKWGTKLKSMLQKHGKLASETEMALAKWTVAEAVADAGLSAVQPDCTEAIEQLIDALEKRLA